LDFENDLKKGIKKNRRFKKGNLKQYLLKIMLENNGLNRMAKKNG
jgi:hypothetical protein